MGILYYLRVVLIGLTSFHIIDAIDPFSIAAAAAALGVGVYENTYCRYYECCNSQYIPANIQGLGKFLASNVFGQHIVRDQVMNALKIHYGNPEDSRKPLVMSFHGTVGTGKNFVADNIANSMYKLGTQSNYVHKFMGMIDFPSKDRVDYYRHYLSDRIKNAVKKCPQSLFIFDEVDKMPSGVFDSITSFLDHHSDINGIDFRKATFIFLSNSGGLQISDTLLSRIKSGLSREETKLSHFEAVTELSAYNTDGGLKHSSALEASVIDHFIPFLPLEKHHVIKCIEKEFENRGFQKNNYKDKIGKVLEYVTYDHSGLFSTSGCKRLIKKVELFIQ